MKAIGSIASEYGMVYKKYLSFLGTVHILDAWLSKCNPTEENMIMWIKVEEKIRIQNYWLHNHYLKKLFTVIYLEIYAVYIIVLINKLLLIMISRIIKIDM